MQINFRSWRDTGITWLALEGVDAAKMQRRAGHESISTTLGYVKMAEDLTRSIGQPFPPLPLALLEASDEPCGDAPKRRDLANHQANIGPRKIHPRGIKELFGGEGGIRTRGRLLTCARLASGYLRPLGPAGEMRDAAAFGLLLQSLMADARFLQGEAPPLEWADVLTTLVKTYVAPRRRRRGGARRHLPSRSIRSIEGADLGEARVRYAVARDLAL